MIAFSNSNYMIYIFVICAVIISLHIFYAIWRRMAVNSAFGGKGSARKIIAGDYSRILIKEILILLGIILSSIALLGPMWGDRMKETDYEGTDVLISLDVSRSMLARDVSTTRLDRAKSAIRLIAESLKGDRIGLIIFAGDAFVQCPLTNDIGAFTMFLESVSPDSINLQGTDMGRMLAAAEKFYKKKNLSSKMLIIITDGEDHEGRVIGEAEKFKEMGVAVYALGLGKSGDLIPLEKNSGEESFYKDRSGSFIKTAQNENLLKELADKTGGFYIDITSSFSGINRIINIIEGKDKTYYGSKMVKEKIDRTYIFLLILIIILCIEMFINERKITIVV
jgi:Ca-activated chloride channel family protein